MGRKFGFSFSAKRAIGISAAKSKISRAMGVPLTKSGRQRKIGRATGCCIPLAIFFSTSLFVFFLAVIALSQGEPEYRQITLKSGQQLIGKIKFVGNGAIITMTNGTIKTLPSSQIDTWNATALNEDNEDSIRTENKGGVTIEKVNLFPDKYVGQNLVFSKCEVDANLKPSRNPDYFLLSVTKDGFYVGVSPSDHRITFAVHRTMAEKMADDLKGNYEWPNCTLHCTIQKLDIGFLAIVTRLDVYNRGGKIAKTYAHEELFPTNSLSGSGVSISEP